YILKGQFWAYKITVRAYDQAGNFTDSFVIKPLSAKVVVALVLLLLIASIFITYKLARPPRRHTRKMV
ncbi:MAG: hypothetical protein Q8R12_00355, partial [bacterium]|nr:hypothetical protein [bacterium]